MPEALPAEPVSRDAATPTSLMALLRSDIERAADQGAAFQTPRSSALRRISLLLTPAVSCVALHRAAHAAHQRGWQALGRAIARLNLVLHRVAIEPSARIGPGFYLPHGPGVVFRGNAGRNLCLYAQAIVGPLAAPFPGMPPDTCPNLGDDVTVGASAIVLGPVTVGDRAQIGPAAVLRSSLPADTTLLAPHLHPRRRKPDLPADEAPPAETSDFS